MDAEESKLFQTVLADPDNDAPRLMYADFLEKHGNVKQAEFIRRQIRAADEYPTGEADEYWQNKIWEVRYGNDALFAGAIKDLVKEYDFYRGFVAHVELNAADFLARSKQLFQLAPIEFVSFNQAKPHLEKIIHEPALQKLHAIALSGNDLEDDDVKRLFGSPYLTGLRWLDLSHNNLGESSAEAIASSAYSQQLRYVSLSGNPYDTDTKMYFDGIGVADIVFGGAELEKQFGFLPWLHVPADVLNNQGTVPSPYRRQW